MLNTFSICIDAFKITYIPCDALVSNLSPWMIFFLYISDIAECCKKNKSSYKII